MFKFRTEFEFSRSSKRIILSFSDAFLLLISLWLALSLRLGEFYLEISLEKYTISSIWLISSLILFWVLGIYNSVIRFINHKVVLSLSGAIFVCSINLVVLDWFLKGGFPRTVPIIFAINALILLGGCRMLIRSLVLYRDKRVKNQVLIYGAGSSGSQLASALQNSLEYKVVAFVDDNPKTHGTIISGVKIYCPRKIQSLINKYDVERILLAIPSASRSERKHIIDSLEHLGLPVQTVPGTADLVDGRADIDQIQDVKIEDLLGRDPVEPNKQLMTQNIESKVVLVTGAGGSIGSELCRQILSQNPQRLLLVEQSEYSLYSIEAELKCNAIGKNVEITPLLGSVRDQTLLESIMGEFGVQTVYHAAAYKHVPLVEHNTVQGLLNNVFGTLNCVRASINTGVEKFVLISTDKAVRPTNVMGTTKRIAELILQAYASEITNTSFSMVRFGNVLGSSGSVVPLFRSQIRSGGPVTVTHPDITRYFMTIPEAAQLVIQAGAMGAGGDVFVLDMGESVEIDSLAKKMIRLSGLSIRDGENPDGDIEIKYTGLRPGEKLYEELLIGKNVNGTTHPRIMVAQEDFLPLEKLLSLLDELKVACNNFDQEAIRKLLLSAPASYQPTGKISDFLFCVQQDVKPVSDSDKPKVVKLPN